MPGIFKKKKEIHFRHGTTHPLQPAKPVTLPRITPCGLLTWLSLNRDQHCLLSPCPHLVLKQVTPHNSSELVSPLIQDSASRTSSWRCAGKSFCIKATSTSRENAVALGWVPWKLPLRCFCGVVTEVGGLVLRDNTYKGVKERGLGGGRRGLLSRSTDSSGAGMALQGCPQLKNSGQAFVRSPFSLPG